MRPRIKSTLTWEAIGELKDWCDYAEKEIKKLKTEKRQLHKELGDSRYEAHCLREAAKGL